MVRTCAPRSLARAVTSVSLKLGRVEAALNGVILNTDAIDNSAGVETSDREVNIKILVDRLVARGELPVEERASFIESLQDEVGEVLGTNVEQNVLLQVSSTVPSWVKRRTKNDVTLVCSLKSR